MAVRIRLTRLGRKKRPFYRLVVAESTSPRDGKVIENVGTYDPTKDPVALEVKKERIDYWLSVGAQLSDPVQRLLGKAGLVPVVKKTSSNLGVNKQERREKAASAA